MIHDRSNADGQKKKEKETSGKGVSFWNNEFSE